MINQQNTHLLISGNLVGSAAEIKQLTNFKNKNMDLTKTTQLEKVKS